MRHEMHPTSHREGNTLNELQAWLDHNPEDEWLPEVSRLLRTTVSRWQSGECSTEDTLHQLVDMYQSTDGKISEVASAALNQSTMWFSYEAEVGAGTQLDKVILSRLLTGEERE